MHPSRHALRRSRRAQLVGLGLLACLTGCGHASGPTPATPPSVEAPIGETAAAAAADPRIGRAMAFGAERLDAPGTLSLATLRGKVVIVDFWASWCVPCRDAVGFYAALLGELSADDLAVIGVSVDEERSAAERWVNALAPTFPTVWDAGQALAAAWDLPAMPTTLILDREGVVRYVHAGFDAAAPAALTEAARALLAAPAAH